MSSKGGGSRGTDRGEMEEDDLEMLRQAALRTLGMNRSKPKETISQTRMKTKGNLIEIQPAELASDRVDAPERISSDDFVVEEFVIEGSDVSLNSSDCDEVIEEVIVSDPEDFDESTNNEQIPGDNRSQNQPKSRSRSRSRSLPSNRNSDDDESDAVSIQSSYSLIMDDDITNNEFQSVEAKFLSRKAQKQKGNNETNNSSPLSEEFPADRRVINRSRSPLPFRSVRGSGRRSRSRERDSNNRNRSTIQKSRSRSRSPLLHPSRRNHSPTFNSSSRGNRRPYRANSIDRNQRRRRSRSTSPSSRSPHPHPLSSNRGSQNSRRARSRTRTSSTESGKQKVRSSSRNHPSGSASSIPKSPSSDDKGVMEKTIKNDNIPPEEMERLEKRRRKFEGDGVAHNKKVIKISNSTSSTKERPSPPSESSKGVAKPNSVLKEKVQKAGSRRSVELVVPSTSDHQHHTKSSEGGSKSKLKSSIDTAAGAPSSTEDDQEDLRTRLIKKKLEKMQQSGSSSSSGPPSSSVVVVSMGSQRIFSQALKNSQRSTGSVESSSSKSSVSHSRSKSPNLLETPSVKNQKPKSEVSVTSRNRNSSGSNNIGSNKKLGSSSSSSRSGAPSSNKGSKSSTSNTKRVVSVTYSL